MKRLFFNIHNILKVKIDIEKPGIQDKVFSQYDYFLTDSFSNPDILLSVGKFSADNKDCYIVDHRYYIKDNYLYCAEKYKWGKWQIEIKNLDSSPTLVNVNSNLAGYLGFPYIVLNSLIAYKLLDYERAMIHACGLANENKGVAFVARGGVGKTSMVFDLDRDGYSHLGDNYVLLGDHRLLSFPVPLKVKRYNVKHLPYQPTFNKKLEFAAKSLLCNLTGGWIDLSTPIAASRALTMPITNEVNLKSLVVLVSNTHFKAPLPIDTDTMANHILYNCMLEMTYFSDYMAAFGWLYPQKRFSTYWSRIQNHFRKSLKDIPCFAASVPRQYQGQYFRKILSDIGM